MRLNGFDPEAIERAAAELARGMLIGMPTETVYGLAARADDDEAVARIFEAKGRPADHPLIVHVGDVASAARFSTDLPRMARRLMAAFWPGPLTVIVPRAPGIARAAAGGQSSIGLRSPSHPVARALLAAAGRQGVSGVAAPSANRFGGVSPTSAEHVVEEFGDDLMVLDGGVCEVGIESTIVDCSRSHPVLLRPGVLVPSEIEEALGEPLHSPDAAAPRASGTLAAHYAPRARVRILRSDRLIEILDRGRPAGVAVYARADLVPPGRVEEPLRRMMPAEARAAAHELFSVLRAFDAQGAQEIWIEEVPEEAEWDGVRDRLNRAGAAFREFEG